MYVKFLQLSLGVKELLKRSETLQRDKAVPIDTCEFRI